MKSNEERSHEVSLGLVALPLGRSMSRKSVEPKAQVITVIHVDVVSSRGTCWHKVRFLEWET